MIIATPVIISVPLDSSSVMQFAFFVYFLEFVVAKIDDVVNWARRVS